jgi:hypothetical protein
MPRSHSRTRVAHRGPRHESDPDRRVKYVLRRKVKGEEVTTETVVVRRHRRSPEREFSRAAFRLQRRSDTRAERQAVRRELAREGERHQPETSEPLEA